MRLIDRGAALALDGPPQHALMNDIFPGIVGGFGLFILGMWLLTENLRSLVSRRLRRAASRWTANRFSALLWGCLAGSITQSMPALTFIVVSILRSGLITTQGALALLLGGGVGVTILVFIVTFDIKVIALYVLGVGAVAVGSERLTRYQPVALSCLGGAMIVLGLVLLKDSAAPLAEEPWFGEMLEGTGESLVLAFLVAALLTSIVQSSSAVSVFGISLATVEVISVDQALMVMYGSFIGSSAIICLLSLNLTGRSRQVAMYFVTYNVMICAVVVPLLYVEIHLGVPLIKAWMYSIDLGFAQQLALVYALLCVVLLPAMLACIGWSATALNRLWPASQADELSRPKFLHDHASIDVDTSLVLADLEQRRAMKNLSQYFDAVRRGGSVRPLRDASRKLLSDITEFLDDLQVVHPMQGVEDRNSLRTRQKLLTWLEDAVGVLCETLVDPTSRRPALDQFRTSICESVDGVLLALIDAMVEDDRITWDFARALTGDRGELMRKMRIQFLEMQPPLHKVEMLNVLLVTNAVEETFFLLSKFEREFNAGSELEEHSVMPASIRPSSTPRSISR